MQPLPKIDLEEDHLKAPYCNGLEDIIKNLKLARNPDKFRKLFINMLQLFSDGILLRTKYSAKERKQIKTAFDEIILAGKYLIGTYYRGDCDVKGTKKLFLNNIDTILSFGLNSSPRLRHLTIKGIQEFGYMVPEIPKIVTPDLLACVSNGAYEPAFLAMNILDIDKLIPLRFSNFNRIDCQDKQVRVYQIYKRDYIKSKVKDKKVLVIEDLVCTGESLFKVMEYLSTKGPESVFGVSTSYSRNHYSKFIKNVVQFEPFICKYS